MQYLRCRLLLQRMPLAEMHTVFSLLIRPCGLRTPQ